METSFADVAMRSNLPFPMLTQREQYRSCHIMLPDHHRVAALQVNNEYYGFFRVEADAATAMKVAGRLQERGDRLVVTQIPKGYALWVWEPKALPLLTSSAPTGKASTSIAYPLLESRTDYVLCHIRVPDLDKRLAAIAYQEQYYSLFKMIDNLDEVSRIGAKLGRRGEGVVVTRTASGYGIWVLEPEAYLD